MGKTRTLLVNPPIYDFSAYDFWMRPYGLLRVAGRLRRHCRISLFDYLASEHLDSWGRGRFPQQVVDTPAALSDIPRYFRRFGRPRDAFRDVLLQDRYDVALIQTGMTYWYPGVREVIEDLRRFQPQARIVLGGVYATLCPGHAAMLRPDLNVAGEELEPLWRLLSLRPGDDLPYWESLPGRVGVLKLTEGCPFRCTYCSVPMVHPAFEGRPTGQCLEELEYLLRLGAEHVAFYDDALLFQPGKVLLPFLEGVLQRGFKVHFHTPNALNARFVTSEIAEQMVRAGFRTFFLGFESDVYAWQKKTGGKVYSEEFARAVSCLRKAGAAAITAYIIIGHPESDDQDLEASMRFAHQQGTRILLSEFSPIPGTPDGERCRTWASLEEPLNHNKTAFTIRRLGFAECNRLKGLCRALNESEKR